MATIKQKRAMKEIVENGGNVSKGMVAVGYSENTAKTPQKLTESKGWLELVEEYLPDTDLAKVHKEGLKATKRSGTGGMKIGIGTDGKVSDMGHTEIDEPDYATRHKYLDTAYKLKGVYAPEKKELSGEIKTNTLTPEQVAKINEVALDE